MILITSANYLSSEFQSEFGKIPPSFLPLGGRRLYEYQAGLFSDYTIKATHKTTPTNETKRNKPKNQKIILSLPQNFALSDFEKAKIAKLGITPLFVPENLSLGQSITYCLNMNLPLKKPL